MYEWSTSVADIWNRIIPYQLRMQQAEIAASDATKASRIYADPNAARVPTRQIIFVCCRRS